MHKRVELNPSSTNTPTTTTLHRSSLSPDKKLLPLGSAGFTLQVQSYTHWKQHQHTITTLGIELNWDLPPFLLFFSHSSRLTEEHCLIQNSSRRFHSEQHTKQTQRTHGGKNQTSIFFFGREPKKKMHHTAAAVLRLLFRFVFLAYSGEKEGTEVCRDTCLHTHTRMRRGSQAPPVLSGLKISVLQQLARLVAGWHGGTSYCMYRTAGGIVESPSRLTTIFPQSGLKGAEGVGQGEISRVLKWLQVVSHTALGKQCRLAGTAATTTEDNCSCPSFLFEHLPSGHTHTPCMCMWGPRSVG